MDGPLARLSEGISLPVGELRHHLIEIKAFKGRLVILACGTDKAFGHSSPVRSATVRAGEFQLVARMKENSNEPV